MVLLWFSVWFKASCRALLRIVCVAKRAVRGAVKGAAIGVGCATVLCCRGSESSELQASLNLGLGDAGLAVGSGQAGSPMGTDTVAFAAGMATAAVVIKAGLVLDRAIVSALGDPKITQEKKKALRCLNVGYSLAKLGLVAGIVKGFSWYVDQCEREGDKTEGVLGGLSAASLVLMSLAKTVWV